MVRRQCLLLRAQQARLELVSVQRDFDELRELAPAVQGLLGVVDPHDGQVDQLLTGQRGRDVLCCQRLLYARLLLENLLRLSPALLPFSLVNPDLLLVITDSAQAVIRAELDL